MYAWPFLMLPDVSWPFLKVPDTLCWLFKFADASLLFLSLPDSSGHFLKLPDASLHFLMLTDIPKASWRFLMLLEASWLFLRILPDTDCYILTISRMLLCKNECSGLGSWTSLLDRTALITLLGKLVLFGMAGEKWEEKEKIWETSHFFHS